MLRYLPTTMPTHFYVVGGGGTGGRLVPLLTQFLKTITMGQSVRGWVPSPKVFIIDDDVVEEKNLLRQNFIQRDIGGFKAEKLANRYSKAFAGTVIPVVKRIDSKMTGTDLLGILYQALSGQEVTSPEDMGTSFTNRSSMLILCVDSAQARRDVLSVFYKFKKTMEGMDRAYQRADNFFVVDAGNEDTFGQVKFFHLAEISNPSYTSPLPDIRLLPIESTIPFIPMNVDYYSGMEDITGRSCADMDQTLAINAIMATLMMGVIQNYMYRRPFTYEQVRFDLNGTMSSEKLSYKTLFNRKRSTQILNGFDVKRTQGVDFIANLVKYLGENMAKLYQLKMSLDSTALTEEKKEELFKHYRLLDSFLGEYTGDKLPILEGMAVRIEPSVEAQRAEVDDDDGDEEEEED